MNSRMDKYYKEKDNKAESRTHRNQDMYGRIPDDNYDNMNLTSNISVIKTDGNIDIESIKEIINEKYDKRASQNIEIDDLDEQENEFVDEITKEYDLKKVIATAHQNKIPNYDRERFEHLRETQYDILNSLNIRDENTIKKAEALSEEEETLINLIKTVNENAERNLAHKKGGDLLEDLMGSDDTEVLEPVHFEEQSEPDKKPTIVEELEKTKQLSKKEIEEELEKEESTVEEVDDDTEENRVVLSKTEELSNSFYTGNYHINKKDLEDFSDLEKEMNGGSIVVKILIVIIVLVTLAVGIYLLNKYLNLGLF